jgi:hypothetical protein
MIYARVMAIEVSANGAVVPIEEAVFTTLLENSVAGTYVDYEHALMSGSIKLRTLMFLCDKGDIPLPLFFAPLDVVEAQVMAKTQKLLAGVSKDTFSIGSRAKVELRDVELIVKDLIRKQELVRKHDSSLVSNKIVGIISKPARSPEVDAERLMAALGLSHDEILGSRNKGEALELMIKRLEENQILVARSVQNYMPQRLSHVKFSGMTIRDNKVPFIFLAGGDHGDQQEPVGRTIFTLALMAVLIGRRIFAPMTWDGGSIGTDLGREYDIAGAMLIPAARLESINLTSLDDVKSASDEFKVTASAVVVRAMRLGLLDSDQAGAHLDELRGAFALLPTGGPRSPIRPENAVRKYGGRELSRRMLIALDTSNITPREFCRTVCLDRLKPSQITDLRRAIG